MARAGGEGSPHSTAGRPIRKRIGRPATVPPNPSVVAIGKQLTIAEDMATTKAAVPVFDEAGIFDLRLVR